MIILHVASLCNNKAVGPNLNVPQNVIFGNKYENVALLNINDENSWLEVSNDKYFLFSKYKQIGNLPKPFNKPDIVVFHGVYFIDFIKISVELRKNEIPYIIVPRCSMTLEAINNKKIKKTIANYIFFNKFIRNAKCIQFLTKNEYLESRKKFKFRDYFVLGNGTETPNEFYKVKERNEFIILYIGRYDIYHKGLDFLLEAIKNNSKWFINNNIKLHLYGTDYAGGLSYLNEFVSKNHLKDIVSILGPIYDKKKKEAILNSDIFIHTSRLEGQPTSVIEAISYGIPVIVTPGTNICDIVEDNHLGYICKFNVEDIFLTIKEAFENKNKFKSISKNEIKYSIDNFSWDSIIKKSFEMYKR